MYVYMYEGWVTSGPCIATIADLLRRVLVITFDL
jgi:hypothetical protein